MYLSILAISLISTIAPILILLIGGGITYLIFEYRRTPRQTSSTQTGQIQTAGKSVQVERTVFNGVEMVNPFHELKRRVPIHTLHTQRPLDDFQSSGSQTTPTPTSSSSSQTNSPEIFTKEVQTFIPIVSDGTQTPPSPATSNVEVQTNPVFVSESLQSQIKERDAIIKNLETELYKVNNVIKETSTERMKIYTMLQLEGTYTINFSSPDGKIETGTLVSTPTLMKWMAEKETLAKNIEWHELELAKYKSHVDGYIKSLQETREWGISNRTQWENLKEEVEQKEQRTKEFKKHKKHIIHDCKEALFCADELVDNIPFYSVPKLKDSIHKIRVLRKTSCVYGLDVDDISSSSEENLIDKKLLEYIPTPPHTPTDFVGTNLSDVTCAHIQEPSAPPLSLS